jgi:ankyrin repeat protein
MWKNPYPTMTAGRTLLSADTRHELFGGRKEEKLHAAIMLHHVELVEDLLDQERIDVNVDLGHKNHPRTLLGTAYSVKLARLLIEAGANVNSCHYLSGTHSKRRLPGLGPGIFTPLQIAAALDNFPLVHYLLGVGANPYPLALRSLDLAHLFYRMQIINKDAGVFADILLNAAETGDEHILKKAISAGFDVNDICTSEEPFSPRWMIENLDSPAKYSTLLQAAVEKGHSGAVDILLRTNVDVNRNIFSLHGGTVLEVAQRLDHKTIARRLIEFDAISTVPVPLKSREYQIFEMQVAALHNNIDKVKALVSSGIEPSYILLMIWDATEDLHLKSNKAFNQRNSDLFKLFCEVSPYDKNTEDPNGESLLQIAIKAREFESANQLVLNGASLSFRQGHDKDCQTLLQFTTSRYSGDRYTSHNELVETLLRMGLLADEPGPNKGYNLLQNALSCRIKYSNPGEPINLGLVQTLLKQGVNLNAQAGGSGKRRKSALQTVIHEYLSWYKFWKHGDSGTNLQDIVVSLLRQGADINTPAGQEEGGGTALQLAISENLEYLDSLRMDLVRFLLDNGADVNAQPGEYTGRTALQHAVSVGQPHIPLVDLLLNRGAKVNAPAGRISGITALQGAAIRGNIRLVKRLLELGADPNALGAEENGRTALEGAAENGRLDTVCLLLDNGAVASESAAEYAESECHFVLAKLIRRHC